MNQTIRVQRKKSVIAALALALVGCVTMAALQNTTIVIPKPQKSTPQPKTTPPAPDQGGNVKHIPYVPPPIGLTNPPPAQGALCMIIPGCKPPAPSVENAFPFSNLTPGGYVILYGKNFTSLNGPGGKMQFSLSGAVHDLVDLQWSDTSVGGRVPDGWNWNSAEEVDMWIVRSDGVRSNNLFPRPKFTPIWDVQQLSLSDLSSFHCAPSDDYQCMGGGYVTVRGNHSSTYGHDSGTDSYKIDKLWHGWVLDSYTFRIVQNHGGSVQEPSGFVEGRDWVELQVHWDEDGGSIIAPTMAGTSYDLGIFIRGPKGYSWKP